MDSEKLGAFFRLLASGCWPFAGTVAENIARMKQVDPEKVVKAAQLAGVRRADTQTSQWLCDTPSVIMDRDCREDKDKNWPYKSLVRRSCVIVLDEPNSNLDEEGEIQLMHSLKRLKLAGKTIVLVAHRPSVLAVVDEIMVMQEGGTVSLCLAPRAMIMQKMAVARQNPGIAARRQEFRSRPQVTVKMDRRNADELAAVYKIRSILKRSPKMWTMWKMTMLRILIQPLSARSSCRLYFSGYWADGAILQPR